MARRPADSGARAAAARARVHRSAGTRRPRPAVARMARRALEPVVVMARQTSFYYSFLVLPAAQSRAIVAVWDFCRAADASVDEQPAPGLPSGCDAVRFWREELAACYGAGEP